MTSFGVHLTDFQHPALAENLLAGVTDITTTMEASGRLSSLWLTDHVQNLSPAGPSAPMPESYVLLAAVAARTSKLRLGVLATSVLYRNPALLAKMVTTLDVLSDGRMVLGIGAAHPRTEVEHRAYGYGFPPVGERMARLQEALEIIRSMVGPHPVDGAPPNWSRPAQRDGIPVLVAGSGEQRLLRLAARYADQINLSFPSGDSLERIPHKLDVLARHCETVGRDPDTITVTYKALASVAPVGSEARTKWDAWRQSRGIGDLGPRHGVFVGEPAEILDQVRPYLAAGVDEMIFELPDGHDPKTVALLGETLADLMTN